MAKVCCVAGCHLDTLDTSSKDELLYFQFPVKPALSRKWRAAIRSSSKLGTESMVCGRHFTADDLETVRGKTRLKGKVVPSVFPYNKNPESAKSPPQPSEINLSEDTNGKPDTPANHHDDKDDTNINDGDTNKHAIVDSNKNDNSNKNDGDTSKHDRNDNINRNDDNTNRNDDNTNRNDGDTNRNDDNTNRNDGDTNRNDGDTNRNDGDTSVNDCVQGSSNAEELVMEYDPGILLGMLAGFAEVTMGNGCMDENSRENCTIECVPEAVLAQDSDSNSEVDIHKEDIEDIIANYHIKQDKKLAERLKASFVHPESDHPESVNQESVNKESVNKESVNKESINKESFNKQSVNKERVNKESGKKDSVNKRIESSTQSVHCLSDDDDDDDVIEVEFQPSEQKEPVFIEISVDPVDEKNAEGGTSSDGDCMILLENVQVDIDPATLMLPEHEEEGAGEGTDRKEDPISLLTSSDESDVILEEPHIDTVEVSDEDEDDVPLVKLLKGEEQAKNLTRILWGSFNEYYCMQCKFTTTKHGEYVRHKLEHGTVLQVCEVCDFTTASPSQFARHKKRHKEEKRYKCHLCDYKARHRMSLIYHLKSHESVSVSSLKPVEAVRKSVESVRKSVKSARKLVETRSLRPRDKMDTVDKWMDTLSGKRAYKCDKCTFSTKARLEMLKHARLCPRGKVYFCKKCPYNTRRRFDFKRHVSRKHSDDDDDND